jgi:hypothetical protein
MYLMCVGSGIDPQKIGLRVNMLDKEYKRFFTLFGGKSITMTYAHTKVGREEQLFAFYLAVKRGIKAGLVQEFKASPLFQEAKDRQEELHKTFCTLHTSISVPKELQSSIDPIYKEELDQFQY